MKLAIVFVLTALGVTIYLGDSKPLTVDTNLAISIQKGDQKGVFNPHLPPKDTQLPVVKCPNLGVKGADYNGCSGRYHVTGKKVSWAPTRPVYQHEKGNRYIYWNTDSTILPPTTYGWSIGPEAGLTMKGVYHFSGEPGPDTEEPWQAPWADGSTSTIVVECIKECGIVFEHHDFKGSALLVLEGKTELWDNLDLAWNDRVSSVSVIQGCIFKGYRGLVNGSWDGGQPMVELTQDSNLQGDKDNQMTSWTCQCEEGWQKDLGKQQDAANSSSSRIFGKLIGEGLKKGSKKGLKKLTKKVLPKAKDVAKKFLPGAVLVAGMGGMGGSGGDGGGDANAEYAE